MKRLIDGVHQFQNGVFRRKQELYLRLSKKQTPQTLFITCSDSRVIPNLITQTDPGEIFVVRNAGNIIPQYSEEVHGESATIEFAISALNIEEVVVCGHSGCGAMQGLLTPEATANMPLVSQWLKQASRTSEIMETNYQDRSAEDRLNIAIQENVLVQIENLRTYPFIQERIDANRLNIYGWVYKIGTGEVFQYDYDNGQFLSISGSNEERLAK